MNDKEISLGEKITNIAKLPEDKLDLDALVNDENLIVRAAVAKQGYKLETLIKDPSWYVRAAVAKQGYGLDILINDEDFSVRVAVANQNYKLETLINDPSWYVRAAVAKQGYGFETLINDEIGLVRNEIAKQGYKLESFINDEHKLIRESCKTLRGVKKTIVIERNFGTYNGNLILYIFEDKYKISSGCYETDSIEAWKSKCSQRLGKKNSDLYSNKIKQMLNDFGF